MSSIDYLDLCRLCLVKESAFVPIFDGEGDGRQIYLKIAACLPVKVTRDDKLPKKICNECVQKIELFYQFCNTTTNAEKQLLEWIGGVDVNDKQTYVSAVINQDQSSNNRLDGNVMQQTNEQHQNNIDMNMMESIGLEMPMMIQQNQTQMTINYTNNTNAQSMQSNTAAQQQNNSKNMDDSDDDHCGGDDDMGQNEELSVKEEIHDSNRTIEPAFVNVSIPCEEAGPSGLQQKSGDIPDGQFLAGQSIDGDPKSGNKKIESEDNQVSAANFSFIDIQNIKEEEEDDDDASTVDEAYYCRICESIFDSQSELANHKINFHSDKLNTTLSIKNVNFPCSLCNKKYRTKFSLRRHTDSRHKSSLNNQANNSPRKNVSTQKTPAKKNNTKNTTNNQLTDSMNNKTSVNIPCSYCNKSYRTNFSLHRHIELRHKSLKQQILNNTEIRNILNQTLCNSDPINVSSISEDNDKKFCCPYCPKKYKSSSGLSDHKKTHLGKYIKCDKCTFSTNYQRNLRIHQSLVHNMAYDYQCEYCSKQYNIRKELTKHERRRHLELLPAESYFKCNKCPKIYGTRENLLKHLKNHPNNINPILYNCDECNYTSKQRCNLTQHVKLRHRSGKFDHACQICHKKYKLLKSLKYHVKIKHDANFLHSTFECDFCKKSFLYKDSIRKHMPIHMRLGTL